MSTDLLLHIEELEEKDRRYRTRNLKQKRRENLEVEFNGFSFDVIASPNRRVFQKLWAGKEESNLLGLSAAQHLKNLAQRAVSHTNENHWHGYGPIKKNGVLDFSLELLYENGDRAGWIRIYAKAYLADKTNWPSELLDEWIIDNYPSINDRSIIVDPATGEPGVRPTTGDNNRVWWREIIYSIRDNWEKEDINTVWQKAKDKLMEIRQRLGYGKYGGAALTLGGTIRAALDFGIISEEEFLSYKRSKSIIRNKAVGIKDEIIERDGGKCLCCGSAGSLEIDHIYPVSLGGTSLRRNLQTLCSTCNRRKHTAIINFRNLSMLNNHEKTEYLQRQETE